MFRRASSSLSRATATQAGTESAVEKPAASAPTRFAALSPRFVIGFLIGIAALFAVLVIATVAERRIYDGRVLPGVHVDGVSSAGEDEAHVRDAVARLGAELARSPVRVRIDGHEMTADFATTLRHVRVISASAARIASICTYCISTRFINRCKLYS
jgi:hypothetical protein